MDKNKHFAELANKSNASKRAQRLAILSSLPDGKWLCNKCRLVLPREEFPKDKRCPTGLSYRCKDCKAANMRKNYNSERACASIKRHMTPAKRRAVYEQRLKTQPEKVAARVIFGNAIKTGKLRRGNCRLCGDANTEGHHPDYSKPLEVEWLCKVHHSALSRRPLRAASTDLNPTS